MEIQLHNICEAADFERDRTDPDINKKKNKTKQKKPHVQNRLTPMGCLRSLLLSAALLAWTLLAFCGADVCEFTPNQPFGATKGLVAPYDSILACFNSVPFETTYRDGTVVVLRDLF